MSERFILDLESRDLIPIYGLIRHLTANKRSRPEYWENTTVKERIRKGYRVAALFIYNDLLMAGAIIGLNAGAYGFGNALEDLLHR